MLAPAPKAHVSHPRRLMALLKEKGITDTRVLSAIESIPRERFVPMAVLDQAWDDIALPIGRGQTISQPYVVALMTSALEISDRDKVLEIGTGSGYQAAILSKLSRRVYSVERHKPLLDAAEKMFAGLHLRNITAICADGMLGWPKINGVDQAPFDKIIVTAGARTKPPQALFDQLKVGGIMVIPVGAGADQVLKKYTKLSDDTWSVSDLCPVRFVPLLPDVATDKEGAAA
jgi:protein-L-isoaspartate(D-aspartate) O-methyltransferase